MVRLIYRVGYLYRHSSPGHPPLCLLQRKVTKYRLTVQRLSVTSTSCVKIPTEIRLCPLGMASTINHTNPAASVLLINALCKVNRS